MKSTDNKTFVKAINHVQSGHWHQYDVLLDARIYGWDFMKEWADYVIDADLENISEVTTGSLALEDKNITKSFEANGKKIAQTPELEMEQGFLSVAGLSKRISAPLKIVWTNQTSTLCLLTLIDDQDIIAEYVDAMAYRTLGIKSTDAPKPESEAEKEEKYPKTRAKANKQAIIGYCLLTASIASAITFFASLFLFIWLEPPYMLMIIAPTNIVFWVCLCIYVAKYRWIVKDYRWLKKNNNEHYIDDIDLDRNKNANIFCGENAIFSKTPYAIIPYNEITWIHPHKDDPNSIVIHTTRNTQHQLKIKNLYSYGKLVNIIKANNPKVIDKANAKEVRKEHPELFEREHIIQFVIACILMFAGLGLFLLAAINDTLKTENIVLCSVFVIASIVLFLYSKFGNSWKASAEKSADRLRSSALANKVAKVIYAVTLTSFAGFLFSGLADFEVGVKICFPVAIACVVPFFLIIFLGLGVFEKPKPIKVSGNKIHVNSAGYIKWKKENVELTSYLSTYVIPLKKKTPEILLYDDGKKIFSYTLQTKDDEDFTGKYFIADIRLGLYRKDGPPAIQISGFVSDTPEKREITINDVGYRTQIYYIRSGGKLAEDFNNELIGQDLIPKALKFHGYTTPGNIRLVGVCPHCKKSFTFHGYAFYMIQNDVAYSDDGLDCMQIVSQDIDKDSWSYSIDGKTFRYYNSFSCPHCKTPYIDYKKYPENKIFGSSGCVHLGKNAYREE